MRMRKKKHGSERLSALSALVCADPVALRETPDGIFSSSAPIRLEIGCGKGDFIMRLSRRDAEYNYFAMEKVDDVLVVALEKYARERGLGDLGVHGGWVAPDGTVYKNGDVWNIPLEQRGNVRFLSGDAKNLPEYFSAGTIDAIYANFSDPWPKSGYENRRLTSPEFLKIYEELLTDGGSFHFKTDNAALFDYSLETLKASPFTLTFVSRDLHASERAGANIMTEYERNFTQKGIPIHALEAVIQK